MVWIVATAALSQEIGVGVPYTGPKSQELADVYGDSLAREWEGNRDSSTIRNLLWQVKDFGPPSGFIRASLVAVLSGIVTDAAGFQEITQYLAVTLLDDWRTASESAISALETGLADTSRDLVRLASGVALVKLGHVQKALPVVEGYARAGWEYADTLDTTHWVLGDNSDPVTPFYWSTWREDDPASEDSLNAYMTRVLSYPREWRRIQAIEFLLVKRVATEQALDAAERIVEHPELCSDGDVEYAEQLNLIHALKTYGGTRGRAIAAKYRK